MRQSDEGKWRDRWFVRSLSKEGKVLYWFLMDNCDCAGFLEYDDLGWANGTNLLVEEVRDGLRALVGAGKVLTSGNLETYEALVWVKNYVKIQLNGRHLSPLNGFHRGIYRKLFEHTSKFPLINSLYLEPTEELPRAFIDPTVRVRNPIGIGIGIGIGNSGEEGLGEGGSDAGIDEEAGRKIEGWKNPLYRKLIEHGLHRTCKYITFSGMVRNAPDVDWEQAVDHVINTHVNSADGGVKNSYQMLAALMKKPAFRDPSAKVVDPNGGLKPRERMARERVAEIEARWRAGEITEDECREQVEEARKA